MRRLAGLLATAALALSACGGSDAAKGPAATTGMPPDDGEVTRASYTAQANEFCRVGNRVSKVLSDRYNKAAAAAQDEDELLAAVAPVLADGFRIQSRQSREFDLIEASREDRETIVRLRVAYAKETALVGRLADAAAKGDAKAFAAVTAEHQRASTHARALADGLGLTQCGSGAAPSP